MQQLERRQEDISAATKALEKSHFKSKEFEWKYRRYKSQGRGLTHVIADLSSCGSIQSIYVMLSRVKFLEGLVVLKWFPSNILEQ
ncbi:hypothetical protein PILCRDRAFT_75315 [Piloderma croceum F 1598]|uniref:Uncharacterized protein n=1 Tax=Piloderma croceum (strain F 1598) TaxID=765440 RepID=A0A0C3F189_PILCF|nr:hypothetical protein PILCRDRAFT_75315 [Piloderma croceum F 1598]